VLFKKCTGCKREFTKDELEKIWLQQKAAKEKPKKNTCPDCKRQLKTYDESRFQKKWYGYLNDDKSIVEHLVLVEYQYYILQNNHDSFEVKVPLINYTFETEDFSEAINQTDEEISTYLRIKNKKEYDNEHKFLTQAFIKETETERQNITAWWL
jgi:hypothetical protein